MRALLALIGAGLFLMIVNLTIFHSSLYTSILDPASAAGTVAGTLSNELHRVRTTARQVLAVGDSRMSFQRKVADATSSGKTQFASIVVPGSTPRCWYYMLRHVDANCDRYDAILIPLENYRDKDWENYANRIHDLNLILPILGLREAPELCSDFETLDARAECWKLLGLRGWSYRADLQALLEDIPSRMNSVRWTREESERAVYEFQYSTQSLAGLSVDWAKKSITAAPGTPESTTRILDEFLFRQNTEPTGKLAAYRRKWLGKIVARYKGSKTKLIFLQLPRGPVIDPQAVPAPTSAVLDFASSPNVVILPAPTFEALERPELFMDALHLNAFGTERISRQLASLAENLLLTR